MVSRSWAFHQLSASYVPQWDPQQRWLSAAEDEVSTAIVDIRRLRSTVPGSQRPGTSAFHDEFVNLLKNWRDCAPATPNSPTPKATC